MVKSAPNDYAKICELLPRLTAEQLAQVRLRAKFLDENASPAPRAERPAARAAEDDYDWLARGIEDELRRRGLLGSGRLPAERIVPGWTATSAAVREDLRRHLEVGGHKWRHPWVALGRVAARVLADYLTAGRVRVMPRTMLQNTDKMLLAIDSQFPGYLASGMLHCCLDPRLVSEG